MVLGLRVCSPGWLQILFVIQRRPWTDPPTTLSHILVHETTPGRNCWPDWSGLNKTASPQAQMFEYFVPTWWHSPGKFRKFGLAEGAMSLRVTLNHSISLCLSVCLFVSLSFSPWYMFDELSAVCSCFYACYLPHNGPSGTISPPSKFFLL